MVKGTEPLTENQWKNMMEDDYQRNKYFRCMFSVYFREQGDANYPKRINKDIEIEMDPGYLNEYLELEENNADKLESMGIESPWAFLSGLRVGLLKIENSAKINYVINEVKKKVKEGKKVIIYSNFVGAGIKNIANKLDQLDINYYEFTGTTSKTKRQQYVNDYNANKIQVLLITKAAGEGIDLKETNAIFILDPPWNDAALEQAIGRAIRYKSHVNLPKNEQYVEVYTMYNVKPPSALGFGKFESADTMLKKIIMRKRAATLEIIKDLDKYSISKNNC